jgi:methylmalonic aciduria homocystinuria type C protein
MGRGSPEQVETAALLSELSGAFGCAGFDLVAGTSVQAYDRVVPEGFRIGPHLAPPLGGGSLLVLVGNDRRGWEAFSRWLEAEPRRRGLPHPFDQWTVETIGKLVRERFPGEVVDLRFVFEGPPRQFAAQHLAEVTGLACRGPAALSVHPVVGPWFALRAALVVERAGVDAPAAADLCGACVGQPCKTALAQALAISRGEVTRGAIREAHAPWLAIRDACPVGREYRYPEKQIRWHYAHDRNALK